MQPVVDASGNAAVSSQYTGTESTPLLSLPRAKPEDVRPLRYRELPLAMNTATKAFVNDSLARYFDSSDTWPFAKVRIMLVKLFTFAGSIYQRRMLTVHGNAFLIYSTPQVNKPLWIVRILTSIVNFFRPAELIRRRDEFASKVQAQVQDVFGAKASEMYEIQGLATSPEAQGRGYGKVLVKAVTDMGDADGRDVWVITSDARPFYERQGFSVVRTALIGANNPAWKRDPVTVSIMSRPAKVSRETGELDKGTI